MDYFKLKPKAREFFPKRFHNYVEKLEFWNEYHIPEEALERIGDVHITYGIKMNDSIVTHNSGWSSLDNDKSGSKFHFTINFPADSTEFYQKKHELISELMDKIQAIAEEWDADLRSQKKEEER